MNIRCSHSVGSVLGQRLRRWPNTEPTLCKHLVFVIDFLAEAGNTELASAKLQRNPGIRQLSPTAVAVSSFYKYTLTFTNSEILSH